MAQHQSPQGTTSADGLTAGEWVAFGFCVVWMLVVGAVFWAQPAQNALVVQSDALRWAIILVVGFVPVGLVWVAVATGRSVRIMRQETFRLQTELNDLRQLMVAQATEQAQSQPARADGPEKTANGSGTDDDTASAFASRREVSRMIVTRPEPQDTGDQPALALGTQAHDIAPPLERPDLIRALNFPDDEHDRDGFAALRRALNDRNARKLVQASQDVLTFLSQDGIYTDDMRPDPVPADVWRRFASGERGEAINRLGAVRDHSLLSLTAGRMREDMIFRDTVHHFLRCFDEMLVAFAANATDTDFLELAETRTARAFMLLARTTGTFD